MSMRDLRCMCGDSQCPSCGSAQGTLEPEEPMTIRDKYPQRDFELGRRNGDHETWENAATYETAYQLARIANALENMIENGLPVSGGAVSRGV
jgi:hypothetical protein